MAGRCHLVLAVFLSTSCSPEQGLQNNQVVVTYFQLLTYHIVQGKQSSERSSTKTEATGKVQNRQWLAWNLCKRGLFLSTCCYSQRKGAGMTFTVHCRDKSFHTTHISVKILTKIPQPKALKLFCIFKKKKEREKSFYLEILNTYWSEKSLQVQICKITPPILWHK